MFKVARRWRMIHTNPVEDAEMPRVDVPEIVDPLDDRVRVPLLATYRRLEQDADGDAEWWRLARHVVEFALGTAMRRGHSQSTITDRYIHAAQVLFPGAAEKAAARRSGSRGSKPVANAERSTLTTRKAPD